MTENLVISFLKYESGKDVSEGRIGRIIALTGKDLALINMPGQGSFVCYII
jgi:hypothetical protein